MCNLLRGNFVDISSLLLFMPTLKYFPAASGGTYLRIERERIEPHGADEGDVRGLRVEDVVVCRDPEAGVLRQNFDNLPKAGKVTLV